MEINEFRNKEIEYCSTHLPYFVTAYGHIEDRNQPENIIQPFRMWPEQVQALKDMKDHKWTIILKARQLGITWLVLHYAAWMMLCFAGKSVIGTSKSETEAMELVRRLALILRNMPELIAEKGSVPKGWKGPWFENTALILKIHFPGKSDSTFQCFASSENAARSFTADLLIFDEWAFQQFARSIWTAAFPVINRPQSGQVIGLSTIERGSLFEELFVTPDNGFYKIFIPWYADPSRDKKWYEDTRKALGDGIQAEYPATIDEALTVPGGAYFPEVVDESILTDKPLTGNTVDYFVIDYGLDMLAAYWFQRDAFGNFQIVKEHCEPNLTIGAAAQTILDLSRDYKPKLWLAPPDLWNRSQETGKSRALIFGENGLNLTKVNNDIAAGSAALKELLTHGDRMPSKLTIFEGCAPVLLDCLKKIQRDKKKPNIYANDPHELTHSVDAARYMAVYWTYGAKDSEKNNKKKWTYDMYEDYQNANAEEKKYLISIWGEPNGII